jgi:uncharacterized protein (TIGR02145 family)
MIIKDGRSTGTLAYNSTDLQQPPMPNDSVNVIQGICPPGWFLPTSLHWGKMFNLVESNYLRNLPVRLDTLYGCDTLYGNNATQKTGYPTLANDSIYHSNPCMHINTSITTASTGSFRRMASVSAYKDLLSTNVAPYRVLDTVPSYLLLDRAPSESPNANWWNNIAERRTLFKAPKVIKRYATRDNPVWSYFLPETAGTDKYGFSILPTGFKLHTKAATVYLGEMTLFTPGTARVTLDATLPIASYIYFQYNALLNAVMPYAIGQSHHRHSNSIGTPVRCTARKRN